MSASTATPMAASITSPPNPSDDSVICGRSDGMPATIPPKMMSETPLPMPFSVMSSPSQTRNIVPAAIEMSAAAVGRALGPVKLGLKPLP